MRTLLWLGVTCFGVLGSVAADAQTLSTNMGAETPASRRNSGSVDAPVTLTMPARLGFSPIFSVGAGAHLKSESHTGLPRGVIGAVIGAIAGGAIGYARVQMYCDGADPCDATRSIVTGAAIGAALGALVEYVVRNGDK
jgi:hypothetical protein